MRPGATFQGLFRSAARRFSHWRARRYERSAYDAAERHARASELPDHQFSDEGGRLNKLRFLRREHMFLEWSSWHSSVKDD